MKVNGYEIKPLADLKGADLKNAYLRDADLRVANLKGADLSGADLRFAILVGADLRGADLMDADLRCADLRNASLMDADLRDANLQDAIVSGTILDKKDDKDLKIKELEDELKEYKDTSQHPLTDKILDLLEDLEDIQTAIERKDSVPIPTTLEELAQEMRPEVVDLPQANSDVCGEEGMERARQRTFEENDELMRKLSDS